MYCTPLEHPTAKKPHRCTSCGGTIAVGTGYVRWRSYMDGDAGTNKMHQECYDMHNADGGQWEYTPYIYDRPTLVCDNCGKTMAEHDSLAQCTHAK